MTNFTARIQNAENQHQVTLTTGNHEHSIVIPPKSTGFGSSMNGGEAILLALATCYCNDIYREAKKLGIAVRNVTVDVNADQDGQDGHVMENIVYNVTVDADAPQEQIENLIKHTDTVAEIQNTLRQGAAVKLGTITAKSS
ncbi:MAG: OsmC family peroxiredoxin [Anaerolineaceae bacterium]|nr:OsmC family peroxiredoxin [Anaerolineaceae bacterium]